MKTFLVTLSDGKEIHIKADNFATSCPAGTAIFFKNQDQIAYYTGVTRIILIEPDPNVDSPS